MKTLMTCFMMVLALNVKAQEKAAEIGLSYQSVGGSYYDVKADHDVDKYGPERLSPTGIAFIGTLDSDKYGDAFIRHIKVMRKEDETSMGSQTFFNYSSPKINIKESKNWNMFLRGQVVHYSQKDHFIYFQVDEELTPDLDQELELLPHAKIDQSQTYIFPEVGFCYGREADIGDLALQGFLEASLAPIAYLNHKSELKQNTTQQELDYLNKLGNVLAAGGAVSLEGMAKYKDRYYLKVKFSQDLKAGLNDNKAMMNNRMLSGEIGYSFKNSLSVNANFGNSELVISDKDRKSIEVYNTVGLGLKYQIPKRKKK